MTRNILLALLTLSLSSCYTLKREPGAHVPRHHGFLPDNGPGGCPLDPATARAPQHPRPKMEYSDQQNIDPSRQAPTGQAYKYFGAEGRGPNGEMTEASVH